MTWNGLSKALCREREVSLKKKNENQNALEEKAGFFNEQQLDPYEAKRSGLTFECIFLFP